MASLIEHNQPLDKRLTKHLLRRSCFQYSKSQLDAMTGKTPAQILATLNVVKSFSWEWPNDPITNYATSNCPGIQDGYWINAPEKQPLRLIRKNSLEVKSILKTSRMIDKEFTIRTRQLLRKPLACQSTYPWTNRILDACGQTSPIHCLRLLGVRGGRHHFQHLAGMNWLKKLLAKEL